MLLVTKAPPDATPFRSRGRDCYLYLGALEMRALQREWGLTRETTDDANSWATKQVAFMQRLQGEVFEDKFAILKVCLARWAEAEGVELSERAAAEILDGIERADGKPAGPKGRILRIVELHTQFFADCFGGDEDESGPKAPTTDLPQSSEPDSSTPSGS